MEIFSPLYWVRKLSISSKFYIIIGCMMMLLFFGLSSFWVGMNTMTSIRAYVGGEGLWSKAQKEASASLAKYASSHDEADYQNFLEFLKVPLGDKKARLELEKPAPDLAVARQGFLDGGNHPDDIEGMILLYRRFRHVSYLDAAIQVWTKGDAGIAQLTEVGSEMHEVITSTGESPTSLEQINRDARLSQLVRANENVDKNLTILENEFSSTLGEGSRKIAGLLLALMTALSFLLGTLTLFIALFIARTVTLVDKTKSEFVAMVSHQLRTPLTLIKWAIERLGKADLSSLTVRSTVDIETIRLETSRMAALISDILDTSRLESGALIVQSYDIDIVAVAKTVLAEVMPAMREKELALKEFYPDSAIIRADPTLTQIIFMNLLSNAVKYTPKKGTITVRITKNASGVVITVADTGYGITVSDREHVFDKFFRGTTATKADPFGTGLGLYLVRSVVTEVGGKIWFESEEGKGTEFHVSLPAQGMPSRKGNIHLTTSLSPEVGGSIDRI
jgi:signal transduction histidine kinase